jgi:hypothetical protein
VDPSPHAKKKRKNAMVEKNGEKNNLKTKKREKATPCLLVSNKKARTNRNVAPFKEVRGM